MSNMVESKWNQYNTTINQDIRRWRYGGLTIEDIISIEIVWLYSVFLIWDINIQGGCWLMHHYDSSWTIRSTLMYYYDTKLQDCNVFYSATNLIINPILLVCWHIMCIFFKIISKCVSAIIDRITAVIHRHHRIQSTTILYYGYWVISGVIDGQ